MKIIRNNYVKKTKIIIATLSVTTIPVLNIVPCEKQDSKIIKSNKKKNLDKKTK